MVKKIHCLLYIFFTVYLYT